MIEQLRELAEWHRVEADDHRANADLFGDNDAGRAELLAAADQHAAWHRLLTDLISEYEIAEARKSENAEKNP